MFKRKEKPVPVQKFEINWKQENINGELKEKQYTIKFESTKYGTDWLHGLSKEDVKELRDLLNKTCLE